MNVSSTYRVNSVFKSIINYDRYHTSYFFFFSLGRILTKCTQEKRTLLLFIKVISFKNVYNSCQRNKKTITTAFTQMCEKTECINPNNSKKWTHMTTAVNRYKYSLTKISQCLN
jgi:hypothetical protein